MFEWVFAVVAAMAWAISAPILETGMKKTKDSETPLLGLLASLLAGILVLTPVFFFGLGSTYGDPWKIVLAGIFTFPVGNFLYYLAIGKLTAKRTAPVANIKPIFSVLLATLLLGEILPSSFLLAMFLIIGGIACLWISEPKKLAGREQQNTLFLFIAVSVPLAWALGEISMGAALYPTSSRLLATYMSLVFGTLVYFVILSLVERHHLTKIRNVGGLRWFLLYGIISFGIGYSTLFTSIGSIGVARTAIITSIWPLLAIPFSIVGEKLRGEKIEQKPLKWIVLAAVLIFAGAMLSICTF